MALLPHFYSCMNMEEVGLQRELREAQYPMYHCRLKPALTHPSLPQVVYRFWFSVVAFSFYPSTVCGLVDPEGIEKLNRHVHFSEKGLCFTTQGSISFP